MRIKIIYKDKEQEVEVKTKFRIIDIIEDKSKRYIAAKVNGKIVGLNDKLDPNQVKIITLLDFDDNDAKQVFWHSAAHLLAHAVKRLFPNAKLAIGPAIESGFYYDFDFRPFTPQDIKLIENEMHRIMKQNYSIEKEIIDEKKARELFKNNPYKLELIDDILNQGGKLSIYKQGDWYDLCRGPHVPSTGYIKAFKLTKISGAYWKGDQKNKQLQRIYGIAFPTKEQLKSYIKLLEEAEKRDHRKLGKELDLFSFHEQAPGMPFFHDKGAYIFNKLVEFMREEMRKRNYEITRTPIILNKSLWIQSGHWEHYKDNMYFTKIDNQEFAIKPMNCPANLLIYKTKAHSYRDLPLRVAEFGIVHRHELSGVLSGLFRVRAFTQDDAHIFCEEHQLKQEIINIIKFCDSIYTTFGFSYEVELSTKPEKAMGSEQLWEKAENILKEALQEAKLDYKINEGEGAFYGPKIDFHLKDAIGRRWQCGTIQLDFSMPEKFDLTYQGKDGLQHRPVMLHRAIYGSIERFLGILIEHYAAKFPLWLSPNQIKILTVIKDVKDYATELFTKLKKQGFRVELDDRDTTISKKVRDAQLQKWNYMLIIGEQEKTNNSISVRRRDNKQINNINLEVFINTLKQEIKQKSPKPLLE